MASKAEQLAVTAPAGSAGRERLFEIDFVRAVTALCVVGVHTVTYTLVLTHSDVGQFAQNAFAGALHFTREIFLAITAFVMVYTYANRPFDAKSFWRKRGIGVLFPYIIWSLFYEIVVNPPLPPGQWLLRLLTDLLTGSASFQLYYILLTLEFYIVLPWFLWLMTRAGKRPWLLLSISFVLQVIFLAVDYRWVQAGPFSTTALGVYINLNQPRFLLSYQFYAVLGGVAALYLKQIRAFLLRYGRWTIAGMAVGLALLLANQLVQVLVEHKGMGYSISVFQPAMAVYSIVFAAFIYWIAYRWSISRAPDKPRGAGFWGLLSSASFGIYLIHAYFLGLAMAYVVPNLPVLIPEPLRVLLTWALIAGVTTGVCIIMLYTPYLSRLIGHPERRRKKTASGARAAGITAHGFVPQLSPVAEAGVSVPDQTQRESNS